MVRIARLTTAGQSLALVISRPMAKILKVRRGDLMAVVVRDGRLIARRVTEQELNVPPPPPAATATPTLAEE